MPLTGSEATLASAASAAAKAALVGKTWNDGDGHIVDGPALQILADAIGEAVSKVVAHITTNAIVSPVGLPLPLTAPPGVAGGPVTGVGSIT
jgi:hypothetical protein